MLNSNGNLDRCEISHVIAGEVPKCTSPPQSSVLGHSECVVLGDCEILANVNAHLNLHEDRLLL